MNETDIFTGDIFSSFAPPKTISVSFPGAKLPQNRDIYFMSKWHEMFEKYQTARLFLRQTQQEKYDDWFNPVEDETAQKYFTLYIKSILYESALVNYNNLVDLSWTWTYVSAEYALYRFDDDGNVTNVKDIACLHTIDDAFALLRETENNTQTPHSEGNPFEYLKRMQPSYSDAVDLITSFWNGFSNSEIRSLYNFSKHKGVLHYEELDALSQRKIWEFHYGNKILPSDISDVQKRVSLNQSISDLIDFDNTKLFPYLVDLLASLKKAVNPSPMIM